MGKEKYIKPIRDLLYLIAFLWVVHLVSYFFPINKFGIIPREISGLPGILFAPFLHHDFSHLAANSVSLFILGLFLITMEHKKIFPDNCGADNSWRSGNVAYREIVNPYRRKRCYLRNSGVSHDAGPFQERF